jgi:hypothetical protein
VAKRKPKQPDTQSIEQRFRRKATFPTALWCVFYVAPDGAREILAFLDNFGEALAAAELLNREIVPAPALGADWDNPYGVCSAADCKLPPVPIYSDGSHKRPGTVHQGFYQPPWRTPEHWIAP